MRHLQNGMTVNLGGTPPATACHDADVYWKIRSATNAAQRPLVTECNGIWRDSTGKIILSKDNIDEVYREEEREFNETRKMMCGAGR